MPDAGGPSDVQAGPLADAEVKRLLGAYGVRLVHEVPASSAEAAAKAAGEIGFPVVLKVVSRDVVHKSDVGGVRVGLSSAPDVEAAAREMASMVARAMPAARVDGFAVQATARGEAEVIVGARRDAQFGPVVMVGLGGIAVEILKDVAFAPAPVTPARARAMIDALAAAPLFKGARGRPPLDVEAVVDTVVRVSWLAADLGPRLVDLEINPLIVERAGKGAVAVDARGSVAG